MDLTLVVLAAGMASRYGSLKQLESIGPSGEAMMDYAVFDAIRAGYCKIVYVIRPEIEVEIRAHVEPMFAGAVQLVFVHQTLQEVSSSFTVPATRTKPWGTAHAILVTEPQVDSPFAVCNADDFYGASAHAMLANHLSDLGTAETKGKGKREKGKGKGELRGQEAGKPGSRGTETSVLIGYRLSDTLSPHGGVSRAICECDSDGYLKQLDEVKQIKRDSGQLVGVREGGNRMGLAGSETVSMNLWGFTSGLFPPLRQQFDEFLLVSGSSCDEEFLIPTAISQQVAQGRAKLRVLQSSEPWMGMTFTQDKTQVQHKLLELVSRGVYPADLKLGLHNQR